MSNSHFWFPTSPYRFAPGTLARASAVNSRLDEVSDGFDSVQDALDLKANAASPTITGTATFTGTVDADAATAVLVPTVALNDATLTKAASIGWVQSYFTSSLDLLPPVTGHSGKFLTTDGTGVSWALNLPSQTGNALKMLTTNGTSASWANASNFLMGSLHTLTGDLTLTSSSNYYQILTDGSTPLGSVIRLPDATTLQNGWTIEIDGQADNGRACIGIETSDGELMTALGNNAYLYRLESNATAVGTWRFKSAIGDINSVLTTPAGTLYGADTTLRASKNCAAFVQVSSGVYLCCAGNSTGGAGIDVFVTSVSGMSLSNGTVSTVGTDNAVWVSVLAVTGGYLCLYLTAAGGAVKAIGITVSGTTATAGSATTVLASVNTTGNIYPVFALSNGTDVLLLAQTTSTNLSGTMLDTSGTGVNIGTTASLMTTGATSAEVQLSACSLSASTFGIAFGTLETASELCRVMHVSYSGLTITPGTITSLTRYDSGEAPVVAVAPLSSTSMLLAITAPSGTAAYGCTVISAMTTTPVDNTASDYMTNSPSLAGGLERVSLVQCGSYYVAAFMGTSDSAAMVVSVSGTTVSVAGTYVDMNGNNSITHRVNPTWDGEYYYLSIDGQVRLDPYTVGSGGLTVKTGIDSHVKTGNPQGDTQYIYRITGEKKVVMFDGDCTGIVVRWGVN